MSQSIASACTPTHLLFQVHRRVLVRTGVLQRRSLLRPGRSIHIHGADRVRRAELLPASTVEPCARFNHRHGSSCDQYFSRFRSLFFSLTRRDFFLASEEETKENIEYVIRLAHVDEDVNVAEQREQKGNEGKLEMLRERVLRDT